MMLPARSQPRATRQSRPRPAHRRRDGDILWRPGDAGNGGECHARVRTGHL